MVVPITSTDPSPELLRVIRAVAQGDCPDLGALPSAETERLSRVVTANGAFREECGDDMLARAMQTPPTALEVPATTPGFPPCDPPGSQTDPHYRLNGFAMRAESDLLRVLAQPQETQETP